MDETRPVFKQLAVNEAGREEYSMLAPYAVRADSDILNTYQMWMLEGIAVMKRIDCRVLIMEACVQGEDLIQARDDLRAEDQGWQQIEYAGLGAQEISLI